MARLVLIIDDNRDTADSLVSMLGVLGYQAKVAYGPLVGITKFTQRFPDIILMDIHMQGMSGVDICRFIRRDPRTAHLPIILMSTDTQSALIAEARAAGANAFIPKPIDLDALENILREVDLLAGGKATSPSS